MSINDSLFSPDGWNYEQYFLPPSHGSVKLHPVVADIEDYIAARDLSTHPFFAVARSSKDALRLWLSQELVMTNSFSQIVLAAASKVRNVHVRAILSEVAYGEHGRYKGGLARGAHPWLLHRLAQSVNVEPATVVPAKATIDLIGRLEKSIHSGTLASIAWIGVGNERLIIPEYSAVQKCFASLWCDADYEPFLKANLTEDVAHSRMCYEAATLLICHDADRASLFYDEAIASVEGRWAYFDQLAMYL